MIVETKEKFLKISPKGKLIAIDYGTKKIGFAITDEDRTISLPTDTIEIKNNKIDYMQLSNMFKKKKITGIIIGIPFLLDGKETEITKNVKKFTNELLKYTNLPIFFQDERLSSFQAEEFLVKKMNMKTKKIKKIIDKVSASYILEDFLLL